MKYPEPKAEMPENSGKGDAIKICNEIGRIWSEIQSLRKHNRDIIDKTRWDGICDLMNSCKSAAREGHIEKSLYQLQQIYDERNRMYRDCADSKDWKSAIEDLK